MLKQQLKTINSKNPFNFRATIHLLSHELLWSKADVTRRQARPHMIMIGRLISFNMIG